MIARLRCLWFGHLIKSTIAFENGERPHFVYHCRRCHRQLVGPLS